MFIEEWSLVKFSLSKCRPVSSGCGVRLTARASRDRTQAGVKTSGIRRLLAVAALAALAIAGFATARALAGTPTATKPAIGSKTCSSGYVHAIIGGQEKCLHAGEFCSVGYEADYETYGFRCVNGRLQTGGSTTTTKTTTARTTTQSGPPPLGRTVLLRRRTRTRSCTLGPLPDRRCSPGAYYSGLTKPVICAASFRTSWIRDVPNSEKHAVEIEYGLAPKSYGSTLEIDHIVSLELGGSNDIANLYPEQASFRNGAPGYRVKDKLENRLHAMVCAGQMSLSAAQQQIAANWQTLYRKVYGVPALRHIAAGQRQSRIPAHLILR